MSIPGDDRMSLALAMPACLSPWRCPSGEATAYTTALLPRLASGKAYTLLASLALACVKAYKVLFARKYGSESDFGSPVQLNSSLYVCGPTLLVGPGLHALSFYVGRCRGEKGMCRDALSIYQNGSGYLSIDLKIACSSCFSFISATPTHNNKKQAKQLEVLLALEFLFMNELGNPTQRFDSDFVEPVLLLPALRAHSRPGALKGFCF
ncbi:hypothetical protein VNO80_03211 [Phaseolus coccineus]|uniref:Uncharacterized protein n=1 Tax=Phaseolus coccineus TaxID=3886 RepID=A0AAN9RMW5_PHACN